MRRCHPRYSVLILSVVLFAGMGFVCPTEAQVTKEEIVDLSDVPQLHETSAEHAARLQWFRDAKFGMFIHWGPCTVGDRELSWGRKAGRPWDINGVQSRTDDLEYDNYYKEFNPVNYDPEAWVRLAKDSGMKYMVLIAKHHDGFCQFDTKLTDYNIMSTPYKKDIVKQFIDACHKQDMKFGLYYSTRDWYHRDYLVGDNAKYDDYYRGQVQELLSRYGKIDIMWFDHVGGRDWSKWRFDKLYAMMYRLQPQLLVNDRAAMFCGPRSPSDKGPVTPDIAKMCAGDYSTPEEKIGKIDLDHDWESCIMTTSSGWSYHSKAETRKPAECLDMLVGTATGGGNLLLNFGPDSTGAFRESDLALLKELGQWLKKYGQAIYATRGGPFANGRWGGATHRDKSIFVICKEWTDDKVRLGALPQKITAAEIIPSAKSATFDQTEQGVTLHVPPEFRDSPYTVVKLTVDQPVPDGLVISLK